MIKLVITIEEEARTAEGVPLKTDCTPEYQQPITEMELTVARAILETIKRGLPDRKAVRMEAIETDHLEPTPVYRERPSAGK